MKQLFLLVLAQSRERFLEIPQTMKDIARCLYFQVGERTSERTECTHVWDMLRRVAAVSHLLCGGSCKKQTHTKHILSSSVFVIVIFLFSLQGAASLTMAAIECVSAFSVDEYLQNHLLHAGALWHLLSYLFGYDFTLDEGGVERHEQSNKQVGRGVCGCVGRWLSV